MEQTTQEHTPAHDEQHINVSRKSWENKSARENNKPFSLDAIISPLEETLEKTFNKFMNRSWLRSSRDERNAWRDMFEPTDQFEGFGMRSPRIDVVDQENEVLVRAELPGVDKKDIDISLSENMMTLRGSTRHEEKVEKDNYFRAEISQGSFLRSIYLPAEIDSDKATASLRDGILEVKLPKVEISNRKSIPVQ